MPSPKLLQQFASHFTLYEPQNRRFSARLYYNVAYSIKRSVTELGFEPSMAEIIHTLLYLGRQPTLRSQHPIRAVRLRSVSQGYKGLNVAVLEPFEMAGSLHEVLSPEDLARENIQHHLLPMQDCQGDVEATLTLDTIYLMDEYIKQNKPVYVHCKSGVGRSALLVQLLLCYGYIKKQQPYVGILEPYLPDGLKYSEQEALIYDDPEKGQVRGQVNWHALILPVLLHAVKHYIALKRPEINLDDIKMQAAENILKLLFAAIEQKRDCLDAHDADYLFLHEFVQSESFKAIKCDLAGVYVCGSKRAQSVQGFFDRLTNDDATWPNELINAPTDNTASVGELGHYCHAETKTEGDKTAIRNADRQMLIKRLQQDVKAVCEKYPESCYAKRFFGVLGQDAAARPAAPSKVP